MTDFLLLKEISRLVGNTNRPRLIHRKGICMKGYFRTYMPFGEYTMAELFADTEMDVNTVVRLSSMIGEEGTADTRRNIKGLSVKFCCEKGDYDLICQSLPVFFIDDEKKFPELFDALSCWAVTERHKRENLWKFAVNNPESINCMLQYYSYRGLSQSFVTMNYYSVNTYLWKNSKGKAYLVRYKWYPSGGEKGNPISSTFAEFMAGFDSDIAGDEIVGLTGCGKFIQYELQVQLIEYEYIKNADWLKKTLSWSEDIVKTFPVGVMKLISIVDNESLDGKQLYFSPSNLIDGIELCGDSFSDIMAASHNMGAEMRGVVR